MKITLLLALRFLLGSAPTHGWLAPPSAAVLETSWSRSKKATVALLSASASSSPEEEEEENIPEAFRKEFLETLDNFGFDQQALKSDGVEGDPLMGYSPEDLETYAEMLSSQQQQQQQQQSPNNGSIPKFKNSDSEEIDDDYDDDDALFLDPDLYIKSRDRLNPDGSIRQSSNDNDNPIDGDDPLADATIDEKHRAVLQKYLETVVEAPDSIDCADADDKTTPGRETTRTNSPTGDDATMDDLWKFLGERGLPTFDPAAAEALHLQVFREEEGHLQQSEAFQASLLDSSAADQAATERRGREYRERQEAAVQELEEQIREFEETMLSKLQKRSGGDDNDATSGAAKHTVNPSQHQPSPPSMMRPLPPSNNTIYSNTSQSDSAGFLQQQRQTSSHKPHKQLPQQRRPVPLSSSLPPRPNIHRAAAIKQTTTQRPHVARPPFQQRTPYTAAITQPPMGASQQPKATAKENVLPTSSWQEVEDPDTKEVFYWNEETGEMRWELEND